MVFRIISNSYTDGPINDVLFLDAAHFITTSGRRAGGAAPLREDDSDDGLVFADPPPCYSTLSLWELPTTT